MSDPYSRLAELGLELPEPFPPVGTYVSAVITGDLLFTAGHVPFDAEGRVVLGKLGEELTIDEGYVGARGAALSALASMHAELGDLGRVRRIVRLQGVVNATPDFIEHTRTIDGASDLLVAVFGEAGHHARLAVGVASLPADIALEIDLVAEIST